MIRLAIIEDCPRIAEIHVLSWRNTYHDFISEYFLYHDFLVQKRIKAFTQAIENKTEETYVYEDNSIIKGILTIGNARDEDKGLNSFELWGIYIDPYFIRQKIGTKLVNYCIDEARKRNRQEIVLWVFEKILAQEHSMRKWVFVMMVKRSFWNGLTRMKYDILNAFNLFIRKRPDKACTRPFDRLRDRWWDSLRQKGVH